MSSRTLGAYSTITTATVTLSDTTSPQSIDYQGITDNYEVVHFTVPLRRGPAQRLHRLPGRFERPVRPGPHGPGRPARADWPTTRFPRASGNYGDAQVADPAPGTWTAYIWSRDSAGGGTTGPVVFGASVAYYKSFGTVSPSNLDHRPRCAPRSVTLSVTTPSTPGRRGRFARGRLARRSRAWPSP